MRTITDLNILYESMSEEDRNTFETILNAKKQFNYMNQFFALYKKYIKNSIGCSSCVFNNYLNIFKKHYIVSKNNYLTNE
jgi:hypothetical protein